MSNSSASAFSAVRTGPVPPGSPGSQAEDQRDLSCAQPTTHPARLSPADVFPQDLADVELRDLQVLHSRVCWQLRDEYLTHPDGAHPVTLDRQKELDLELAARDRASTR